MKNKKKRSRRFDLEKEYGFRLMIHERDWIAGRTIRANIMDGIEKSRRIIFVLSRYFPRLLIDNSVMIFLPSASKGWGRKCLYRHLSVHGGVLHCLVPGPFWVVLPVLLQVLSKVLFQVLPGRRWLHQDRIGVPPARIGYPPRIWVPPPLQESECLLSGWQYASSPHSIGLSCTRCGCFECVLRIYF